jgi:hypothetical protein
LDVVVDWIHEELGQLPKSLATDSGLVRQALDDLKPELEKTIGNSESGNFRRQLTQLVRIIQATCLLRSNPAVSSAFIRIHLVAQVLAGDPPWLAFLDDVRD